MASVMAVLSPDHRSTARMVAAAGLLAWTVTATTRADRPAVAIAGAVVATAGLFTRPRWPALVLTAALAGWLAAAFPGGFAGPDDPFTIALAWSSYGVGRHESLRRQPWAAAATLAVLSLNLTSDDFLFPESLIFPSLFTAAPWLAGLWIQLLDERSASALRMARDVSQVRTHEVQRATAEERLRLARELHDVAAHHMTTVSLQSQVLRERLDRGEPVSPDDAAAIGSAAQAALGEIRRVVGVLRSPGEQAEVAPLPSLADLPALIETSRQAGQEITFAVEGTPRPLPEGLSLTLYRIAQEALSNARRHGGAASTDLTLVWGPGRVTLRAENGMGPLTRRVAAGNGILGMRERVELYGGRLDAGPEASGLWAVEATLPVVA